MSSRPKKTNITRTRTGCYTCRQRRVKCDETKPVCKACTRLGVECEGYQTRLRFTEPAKVTDAPSSSDVTTVQWGPIYVPEFRASEPSLTLSPFIGLSEGDRTNTNAPGLSDAVTVYSLAGMTISNESSQRLFDDASTESDSPCAALSEQEINKTLSLNLIDGPELDDFYFQHWRRTVVEIVPAVFAELTRQLPAFLPLRKAVLAVSAANMAHVESSTVVTHQPARRTKYIPERHHRHWGLRYYSEAVQLLAWEPALLSLENVEDVFGTLLLFHFFELDAGSFADVLTHMEGIETLVPSAHVHMLSRPLGRKLLCTWLSTRSLITNRRLSRTFGTTRPPLLWQLDMDAISQYLDDFKTGYDAITMILCDCLQTMRRIILDWFVCRQGDNGTEQQQRDPLLDLMLESVSLPTSRQPCSVEELSAIDDEYMRTLQAQRVKLDEWHSKLDIFELPMEDFISRAPERVFNLDLGITPLQFHTHDRAMNYAYYAAGHLLSSEEVLQRIRDPTPLKHGHTKPCQWEILLLRITAGLDPQSCVYKNTFDFGIVSIMTLCAAWCPDVRLLSWVNNWVQRIEEHGIALESALTLSTMKRSLKMIDEKKRQNCDIYLASLPEPEHLDRDEIYKTDQDYLTVLCWKDRRTARLYHEVSHLPL